MKYFTKENGVEHVHVQKKDIKALCQMNIAIPLDIHLKIWKNRNPLAISEEEQNEYVIFEGIEAISFFKNLDWIIDYDFYNQLSKEELELETTKSFSEMQEKLFCYTRMSKKEQKNNSSLFDEYQLKKYKLNSLYDLQKQKYTNQSVSTQVIEKMHKLSKKIRKK